MSLRAQLAAENEDPDSDDSTDSDAAQVTPIEPEAAYLDAVDGPFSLNWDTAEIDLDTEATDRVLSIVVAVSNLV
jgi:hypothetical protein